jgi:hypothetical protein
MILFKRVKVRSYEAGLYFRDGEFKRLLSAGRYWLFDLFRRVQVDIVSQRVPWLVHDKLDVIVKSGALAGRAEVVDLKDYQPTPTGRMPAPGCWPRSAAPTGKDPRFLPIVCLSNEACISLGSAAISVPSTSVSVRSKYFKRA